MKNIDSALELHHRHWDMDGDLYRCRVCKRGQLASYADEKFVHAAECTLAPVAADRPWLVLADMVADLVQPVITSSFDPAEALARIAGLKARPAPVMVPSTLAEAQALYQDADQHMHHWHRNAETEMFRAKALEEQLDKAMDLLNSMTCGYRQAIENGHERIVFHGGECDSPEKMLSDNPAYGQARELLAAFKVKS